MIDFKASSPSCTELETVMMDWLAKALNLPDFFLHNGRGPGGGVIQGEGKLSRNRTRQTTFIGYT